MIVPASYQETLASSLNMLIKKINTQVVFGKTFKI